MKRFINARRLARAREELAYWVGKRDALLQLINNSSKHTGCERDRYIDACAKVGRYEARVVELEKLCQPRT